ncbi:hypothetical protein EBU94_06760 [bacterium]|jgi:hypothetical protein|nr:hypothetical protein [bacterium]
MKIVISENQSKIMVEIIKRIVSAIDFEGGVNDFEVYPPDFEDDLPTYDIILNLNYDWIQENEFHAQQYLRNVRAGVKDKVIELTGLKNIYVGTMMK